CMLGNEGGNIYPMRKNIYPMLKHIYPMLKHIYPMRKNIYPMRKNIYLMLKHIYPMLKHIYPMQKNIYPMLKHIYPMPELQPVGFIFIFIVFPSGADRLEVNKGFLLCLFGSCPTFSFSSLHFPNSPPPLSVISLHQLSSLMANELKS
uniref:Uncharacterized protein n=1 Tax=Cyprinodon variegatus TaxID=28743 RepID=A0A3Q2DSG0_CYPVA